jgi:5-methylcytosine-specific restriction enzyme B
MGAERTDRLIGCLERLNNKIADDRANLGAGYQIGHSYFCQDIPEGLEPSIWLRGIIDTEIVPLLNEYWIDDPGMAERWAVELAAVVGVE